MFYGYDGPTSENVKNCSLSMILTATDQKPQKSLKRLYYPPLHRLTINVMLSNVAFFMIFAVKKRRNWHLMKMCDSLIR